MFIFDGENGPPFVLKIFLFQPRSSIYAFPVIPCLGKQLSIEEEKTLLLYFVWIQLICHSPYSTQALEAFVISIHNSDINNPKDERINAPYDNSFK